MTKPADTTDASDRMAMARLTELVEELREQRKVEHDQMFGASRPPIDRPVRRPYYGCGARMPKVRRSNGVPVDEAAFWLNLCHRLCIDADDFDHDTRRGWTIACRLLGLSWMEREHALYDVSWYGAEAGATCWAPYLSEPDARYVGVVYTAEVVGDPDFVKVGFSTNTARRAKELARIEGRSVVITSERPGTMLHEWGIHQHGRYRVKGRPEWYRREGLPAWLVESQAEAA